MCDTFHSYWKTKVFYLHVFLYVWGVFSSSFKPFVNSAVIILMCDDLNSWFNIFSFFFLSIIAKTSFQHWPRKEQHFIWKIITAKWDLASYIESVVCRLYEYRAG